ncbi:MAG: hypothetical protein KDC35_05680 [Acidobacteria bacterium]|nr:hypothetical protein [Acidobacteriota bacterium]
MDGVAKVTLLKRVLKKTLKDLDGPVGVLVFGGQRRGDCQDVYWLNTGAGQDQEELMMGIDGLNPKGTAPISLAITQALETLAADGRVLLISTSLESCEGDGCAVINAARSNFPDRDISVIGLDLQGMDPVDLECLAQRGSYWDVGDAAQLESALTSWFQPGDRGVLNVTAKIGGAIADVIISITDLSDEKAVTAVRTYNDPATNPRVTSLPPGSYRLDFRPLSTRGVLPDPQIVQIEPGKVTPVELNLNAGSVVVKVTRNGQLSDAAVQVFRDGKRRAIAVGRTYTLAEHNPKTLQVLSGTYDVEIASVELGGDVRHRWNQVVVGEEPLVLSHDFKSGLLRLGGKRDGKLTDMTVTIEKAPNVLIESRTYVSEDTNPRQFILEPGDYDIRVVEVESGTKKQLHVQVTAEGMIEKWLDFP